MNWTRSICGLLVVGALSFTARRVAAEDTVRVTLSSAVQQALAAHPSLVRARALEDAATARVDEARLSPLPDLGVSAQVNRSTGNTVPGAFFTTPGFVPIAGLVQGRTLDGGAWQTGVSLWTSWNVTGVLQQGAAVDAAKATHDQAEATTAARRLEIAYGVADAFISLLESQEAEKAAQANVARAQVFLNVVKPLAEQSLRPGADVTRAEAELALAHTQLIRMQQATEVRQAELAQAMGTTRHVEAIADELLGAQEVPSTTPKASLDAHPLVRESDALARRAQQTQRSVRLSYLPKLELAGSVWLRGSGLYTGVDAGAAKGLVPDIPNWAAGAIVTWSALDIPELNARLRTANAEYEASLARKDEVLLALVSQQKTSSALSVGAKRIAKNTPAALTSARASEAQARARYQAGLNTAIDVADAQRVLAQAELDDALARLEVRRTALLMARASGDLSPLLTPDHGSLTGGR